ncbi:hypothetical protein [Streptomyces sp. NBC_01803]|uniref:hypothetical protein n=1 Tax=Streptomyces sp. NBC_01803 TaxID=2975946 RepID=UPI002DDB11E7|nr:hypothetical protein [Streptomyces sp. NBC_01803]WSA44531.1 hypothetical protein OIE51_10130 [Streptomyces sp. NBC_01803]
MTDPTTAAPLAVLLRRAPHVYLTEGQALGTHCGLCGRYIVGPACRAGTVARQVHGRLHIHQVWRCGTDCPPKPATAAPRPTAAT